MDELRNDEMQDEELERYGVWVKAGPEEVVEADDDYSLSDLADDTDVTTGDEPEAEPIAQGDNTEDTADLPALDEFDDISLDDLDFGESDDIDTAEEPPTLGEPTDELTIGPPDDSTSQGSDDDDLISLDDFDLEVPDEDPDPFQALPDEDEAEAEAEAVEDFNLDELEEELPDDFEELDLDDSDSLSAPDTEESDDFDPSIPGSDGELDDLSVEDISVEDSSEELPELEVDSIDESEHDFTPEDQGIDIEPVQPSNTISPDEEDFLNDESDLQNDSESAIPIAMDLQEREAFERIQTELTDIKKELAELKAALRGAGTSAPEEVSPAEELTHDDSDVADVSDFEAPAEETSPEDAVQPGPGFFEEEEDETIALTGDELDNILNTAEFTEQAGEAEELEDDFIVEPEPPAQEDVADVDDIDLGFDDETPDDSAADDSSLEDNQDEVASIELEPVDRDSVVFEGDDSAVDELAEMDIDSELADIDSLEDETEDASDDLEIDIGDLDEVDTSGVLEENAETAAEESAAEMDQQALQADTADLDDGADSSDDLDIDDLDLDDLDLDAADADDINDQEDNDFDQFAAAVEEDIATGSEDAGVQLDAEFDHESAPETTPEAIDLETADLENDDDGEIEIDLDDIDGLDEFNDEDHEGQREEPAEPEESEERSAESAASISDLPDDLKQEIRSVLSYMDQLLEALPDDKIEEFAHSEHFEVYKKLFEELGLET